MNVKQIVIERIQEELKAGRVPWQSPYLKGKDGSTKCNFVSGHSYRGMNELLLAFNPDTYYMTFKQAQEIGAQVKKGAKSEIVTFWKMNKTTDRKTGEEKTVPILNYYRIFGISQIDFSDCEEKYNKLLEKRTKDIKDNKLNVEVSDFIKYTKAQIRHERNSIACYSQIFDYINMPHINTFENATSYTETLFHELTHWTGHKSRLDRLPVIVHKRSEEYSKEELIAELGSCFLCAEFGITPDYKNSASYIQSWSTFIKDNNNALFSASTEASKAVEFLKELVSKNVDTVIIKEEIETEEEQITVNPESIIIEEEPKEKETEKEEKEKPESIKIQAQMNFKDLSCTLFKKYITNYTQQINIDSESVKFFNADGSIVIVDCNVNTDQSYCIHSTALLKKDIKRCKGNIRFADYKIITDSIITGFDTVFKKDQKIVPVEIPENNYYNSGLVSAVSKVIHSASTDNIKPVFHSACFSDNKVIATDSRRLSMTDFQLDIAEDVIIDRYAIDLAIKDKLDYISIVTVQERPDMCYVDFRYAVITNKKDVTVISKEVNQIFPNYKQIIPSAESITASAVLNTKDLLSFLKHKEGCVFFNENTITHKQTGHFINIPFLTYNRYAFNPQFLYETLSKMSQVTISFTDETRPSIFTDGITTDYIMPVQLSLIEKREKEGKKVA